ncbi:MAG: TetR/AcrR family transcriptional regulator [Burkholderiaceae bacterium]|nr:TetR/AcrR family transcriptional regulator [Burkholderiaceae bacterium]
MKVTREEATRNRERIIDAAARLFREKGFDGIGVADLMKEVGLTHGGFYGHFASKDDLEVQACARALARSLSLWKKRSDAAPDDPLSAITDAYLTARHRDDPGAGCLLAALGPDLSRRGPGVRRAVTEYLDSAFGLLAKLVPGRSKAARRRKAIGTYASLVGALVLARAVDDDALSREILDTVREALSSSHPRREVLP